MGPRASLPKEKKLEELRKIIESNEITVEDQWFLDHCYINYCRENKIKGKISARKWTIGRYAKKQKSGIYHYAKCFFVESRYPEDTTEKKPFSIKKLAGYKINVNDKMRKAVDDDIQIWKKEQIPDFSIEQWKVFGKYFHIDHIYPFSYMINNFTREKNIEPIDLLEEEYKQTFIEYHSLELNRNLRIISKEDNIKRSNNMDYSVREYTLEEIRDIVNKHIEKQKEEHLKYCKYVCDFSSLM